MACCLLAVSHPSPHAPPLFVFFSPPFRFLFSSFSLLFSTDSPTSDSAKSKVSVRLRLPAEASAESRFTSGPIDSSAGFLGFSQGPVHPRPPGLLHFCSSQPQKEEVKGETAAQQLRRRPRLRVPQKGDPRPEGKPPPPPPAPPPA